MAFRSLKLRMLIFIKCCNWSPTNISVGFYQLILVYHRYISNKKKKEITSVKEDGHTLVAMMQNMLKLNYQHSGFNSMKGIVPQSSYPE